MTDVNKPGAAPAGWYTQGGRQRWWDGYQWGDFHVVPHKPTNHVFHLLMSVLTIGLWVPVWIIVAVTNRPPRQ